MTKRKKLIGSKFPYGTILRIGDGSTALIRLVSTNKFGPRASDVCYYGQHCMGGVGSGYGLDVKRASAVDRKTWRENAHWRKR